MKNNPEIIQLLLEKGANVNMHNMEGKTALDYALEAHNVPVASLLQKRKAFRR